MSHPETLADLNLVMVRDYATKKQVQDLEREVDHLRSTSATLETKVDYITVGVDSINDTLRWLTRAVLGTLIGGATVGAAYFLALQVGLL